jgi:hypothetical protein
MMIKNFNPYHFYTPLLFHRLKSQKHHLNSRFVAINYFKKVYDASYDLFMQDLQSI